MSETKTEKTNHSCPVCGGDIISTTTSVPNRPAELMVDGPGSEDNFKDEESFHCERCGLMFRFPTPRDISDMMKRHREMNAANTGLLGAMLGR